MSPQKRQKWPVTDAAIRRAAEAVNLKKRQARNIVRVGDTLSPRDSGHIIEDEGTPLPNRKYLNFIGDGVVATDNEADDATDVTVDTSGGGGPPGGDDDGADRNLRAFRATVPEDDPIGPLFVIDGATGEQLGFNQIDYTNFPATFLIDPDDPDGDPVDNWNPETGRFYAPYSGVYRIDGACLFTSTPASTPEEDVEKYQQWSLELNVQGSRHVLDEWHWYDPIGRQIGFWLSGGRDLYLTAGQFIGLEVFTNFPILGPVVRAGGDNNNALTVRYLGNFGGLGSDAYHRSGDEGGGSLTFFGDAPGYLTDEGEGNYVGYWRVSDTHAGYNKAGAKNLVASQLNSWSGWRRAGVSFAYDEDLATVEYQVVTEATCDVPELACTHFNYGGDGYNFVELEYGPMHGTFGSGIGVGNIVNHETGHAFFGAEHTGTGIMADIDFDRPNWPTDDDIASVRTWLGL